LSQLEQKHFPCACLLALEDAGTKLHVFPNSHRSAYERYKAGDETVRAINAMVEIRLQKGQLLIFNALLIHYGPEYSVESKFARLHTYILHPKVKSSFLDKQGNTQTHPVDFDYENGHFYRFLRVEQGMQA
jgi:hypothetical protein